MVPTIRMPEGFVLTIDDAQHSYINDLLPREERRRLLRVCREYKKFTLH